MAPSDVPNYWEQSLLVARNPVVAARFFNLYMKAFIKCLLRYDPKHEDTEGGILGVVRSYYGCVEAQGRGTLHCHMMIWVEGSLNPTELKARCLSDATFSTRLLSFLDDTISNAVPPKPSEVDAHGLHANPCAHRGVPLGMSGEELRLAQEHDIHTLVSQCQVHEHTHTCYKYWKGPPEPRECRFDLEEGNVQPQSYMNEDTGELCLRCLDGLVNNFNATIITAMRCNMDIQFVTSGASAKAILHYITDYITKSELKAHIAYAALERAVVTLGRTEVDADQDEFSYHAKRMLQRCAYAMISEQELSGQQVALYLLQHDDHFTSDKFQNLLWTPFERHLDKADPSPECNPTANTMAHGVRDTSSSTMSHDVEGDESEDEHDETHTGDSNLLGDEEGLDSSSEDDVEVTVGSDSVGNLIARCSQVVDYQLRGEALTDMCLWDFIAQVEKVHIRRYRNSSGGEPCTNEHDDLGEDEEEDDDVHELDPLRDADQERGTGRGIDSHTTMKDAIASSRTHRPIFPLHPRHPDHETHVWRVLSVTKRRIPVTIGPALPRRDREVLHAKYCRVMLMFFKPWTHAEDLRQRGQTWPEAFVQFVATCEDRPKEIRRRCDDSRHTDES